MSVVAPDTSEFQKPLDRSFNRPVAIFRVGFGAHYLDPKFLANASAAKALHASGQIEGAILYHVYLSSQSVAEQFAAVWGWIGPTVPEWLLGIEIDVESWRGTSYPISGDHSAQINQLGGMHAHKLGSFTAVPIYGNAGDLAEIVPRLDRRFPVNVANYSRRIYMRLHPNQIAQQYTDGSYAAPAGLPVSTPPFGRCDHNVFPAFANGRALREFMRPATVSKPKPKPPPPPRPVTPCYPYRNPHTYGNALVSADGSKALILQNNGSLAVHDRGTTQHKIA